MKFNEYIETLLESENLNEAKKEEYDLSRNDIITKDNFKYIDFEQMVELLGLKGDIDVNETELDVRIDSRSRVMFEKKENGKIYMDVYVYENSSPILKRTVFDIYKTKGRNFKYENIAAIIGSMVTKATKLIKEVNGIDSELKEIGMSVV
jgi:hypothetical protein